MTEQEVKAIFVEVVKLVEVRVNRVNRFRSEGQKLSCMRGPEHESSMAVLRGPDSEGKYDSYCVVLVTAGSVFLNPGQNTERKIDRPEGLQTVVRKFLDSVLPEQGH